MKYVISPTFFVIVFFIGQRWAGQWPGNQGGRRMRREARQSTDKPKKDLQDVDIGVAAT